jgi:hypothetical protein
MPYNNDIHTKEQTMNKLLTAMILSATAVTAQAWGVGDRLTALKDSIKGQDLIAMITQCNTVSYTPEKTLTEQERKEVEAAVKAQLKDPESARFGAITFVSLRDVCKATTPYKDLTYSNTTMRWEVITKTQSNAKPIIKGFVNAKNSYGGYTGEQQFIVYENHKIQF